MKRQFEARSLDRELKQVVGQIPRAPPNAGYLPDQVVKEVLIAGSKEALELHPVAEKNLCRTQRLRGGAAA